MINLQRILIPVSLPDAFTDASRDIPQQAAWLARRFHSEAILLHVMTPFAYPAGLMERGHAITEWDLESQTVRLAQQQLDELLLPELDGITVKRLMLRGNPAHEIAEAARDLEAGLIVMSTHGQLLQLMLGSVTHSVLMKTSCPVWTAAHAQEPDEFSIRRVLCSVELTPRSLHTLAFSTKLAAAVDATLTLVHVTTSVEVYGPGGTHDDAEWKKQVVGFAVEEIAKLQKDAGTSAAVIIKSGDVPQMLNEAAAESEADVLVIGHILGRSHMGDNGEGYGIVRSSRIPVLSV